MFNTIRTITEKRGQQKTAGLNRANMDHVYAEINREIAALMPIKERIVFGPAEDFEYKVPLEDFQNSRQAAPPAY